MTMRSSLRAMPLLLLLAACGGDNGDSDGEIYDHDPNPLPTPPDINTTVDPVEFPTFRFSQIQKPYEDAAGCLAFAAANNTASDATTCMCNNCLETIQECDAMQGCREIRACSEESGCDSELSCYLIPGSPCVEVIDKWGNASVAVTVSIEFIECSKRFKCQ
jgi:hypothetical protein